MRTRDFKEALLEKGWDYTVSQLHKSELTQRIPDVILPIIGEYHNADKCFDTRQSCIRRLYKIVADNEYSILEHPTLGYCVLKNVGRFKQQICKWYKYKGWAKKVLREIHNADELYYD